MKVFLSWSGQRSKLVAELLNDWLRCVLQAARPWISTRDVDRGAIWFAEISEQLGDTGIGIVCLTAENKTRPWILFEAGALTKGLSRARVCTFLIDLQPTDVEDPLAQFNHTLPERESVEGLVRTLNGLLKENALDPRILKTVFDTYWQHFAEGFAKILQETPDVPEPERTDDSVLIEILKSTRSMNARLRSLEDRSNAYPEEALREWRAVLGEDALASTLQAKKKRNAIAELLHYPGFRITPARPGDGDPESPQEGR